MWSPRLHCKLSQYLKHWFCQLWRSLLRQGEIGETKSAARMVLKNAVDRSARPR